MKRKLNFIIIIIKFYSKIAKNSIRKNNQRNKIRDYAVFTVYIIEDQENR